MPSWLHVLQTLNEHFSVILILGVPPYQYSHLLATPAIRRTGTVHASELAHDVCRVCVIGVFIAIVFKQPCGVDCLGDCFDDVLMDQRKHERRSRLSFGFGELLFALHHFGYCSNRAHLLR